MNDVFALLENNKLSRTPCRIDILKTLFDAGSALSEAEIRERIDPGFDRTTVYRTLRNFLNQDVIHSIALDNGEVRYALTHSRNKNSKNKNHVHFYCTQCSNVYCLSHQNINLPDLPEGFQSINYDLLIHGKCKHCNKDSIS
ncbi:MAG: Fur family transcriptional regulator [Bacteroidota bacterium]